MAGEVTSQPNFSSLNHAEQSNSYIESEVRLLSCVRHFATPWTVAYQAPLSMGFSRQEYWSGLPCPSPGDLPNPGNRTWVSHIVGRHFTVRATREVYIESSKNQMM